MGKLGLRVRYGRVAVATGAVAAASAGFLLIAGPASAHSAPITGSAACASNGTYTVTYQVNVSTLGNKPLTWTFTLKNSAPAGSSVESFNPNGANNSTLTLTQINVPKLASTASVTGYVIWSDGINSGDQTGSVALSGSCTSSSVAPPPVTSSSTAPTSVATTSTAPTSAATTSTASSTVAPTSVATTSTAATTAPAGTSVAIAPPAPSTSTATTAPVSSFNNAPPPPTTHAIEATSASNSTSPAVAVDVPSASPSATDVSSPALASTGPELPIGRTIAFAGLLAAVGALLLVLARRRQQS